MQTGSLLALGCVTLLLASPATAATRSLGALTNFLGRADGGTDHLAVAAALDELRSMSSKAAPAAETLSELLRHRAPLYRDRDKTEVVRLRAYLLTTLSDIGYPRSADWALFDTLAHADERISALEVGAAAHAARSLGARGRDLTPYLLQALTLTWLSEEEFSLERYETEFPANEATTIQLEAVRALAAVASAEDGEVLRILRQLASARTAEQLDPRVVAEARRAVATIDGDMP